MKIMKALILQQQMKVYISPERNDTPPSQGLWNGNSYFSVVVISYV